MFVTEHQYAKDGVTVIWKPALCAHSGVCVRGLGAVFDPRARPWIDMNAAPVEEIAAQVRRCPSGALSLAPADPTKDSR